MTRRAVVLVSGGIDSTTVLAAALDGGRKAVGLSIIYGQRHDKETVAAGQVCDFYGVEHRVLRVPQLAALLAGSALTDARVPVPEGHYADESMRATVVPNRNMILAAVAVGFAVSIGAGEVLLGVHAGDHPIYPDCRPEFVSGLDDLVQVACAGFGPPRVKAPFVRRSKAEVVATAARLGAPLHLTWSCYQGGDVHCGRCGTCVERREAFDLAGVPDPTRYEPATV